MLEELKACEEAVDHFRERYGAQLLERADFVARTVKVVRSGPISVPERAVWYVYSAALYEACSGQTGPERQRRGYTELFRYLHQRLTKRYPDVEAEEVAQETLTTVYSRFDECQRAHTFIAFAFQRLWSEVRRIRRRRSYEEMWQRATMRGEGQQNRGQDASSETERQAWWQAVEQLLNEAKQRYPNAAQQFEVVRLTFVEGLEDNEIARTLGISLTGIPSRRSRGLRKLRDDPELGARARELGLF